MKIMFATILTTLAFALTSLGLIGADDPKSPEKSKPPALKRLVKPWKTPVDVPAYLQDVSVTIRAGSSEGSGVITNIQGTNYVWTAGHVVANLKRTREVIDQNGSKKTMIEFDDAEVVKELIEEGRTVGQMRFFAKVIRYTDSETGEDLALLKVRKKDLSKTVVHFYLDEKIPLPGTDLYHVGSLLGQSGSNSFTTGVISQIGRLHQGVIFDQTSCAAFPGSSGGGVFLRDGRYCGMIVRGAGETFNLIVPIRRMHKWANKMGVEFTLNPELQVPSEEKLNKFPVEDTSPSQARTSDKTQKQFKFRIRILDEALNHRMCSPGGEY